MQRIAGTACEGAIMTRIKLKFVNEYRDRHGKFRRYFRRPGVGAMAAYQSALVIVSPPPPTRFTLAFDVPVFLASYRTS
jgi:hypothetical protein